MIFGIPWFAMIPIIAIVGGLLYAYKEQELKFEEKRLTSSREVNELRKIIHNLKTRIEKLETIVAENNSSTKSSDPLNSIEIDDEVEGQNNDNTGTSRKSKSHI